MWRMHHVFVEVISATPIEPVPRPIPPDKGGIGDSRPYSKFKYEVALQEYAIAQLRGRDEDTAKALRRRLPASGWKELGLVPAALISYEATTVRSANSQKLVRLRIDRRDLWTPQWSTLFGNVAVQCRPADTRFRLITVGTTLEVATLDEVVETEWPIQRGAKGGLMAKLCGH